MRRADGLYDITRRELFTLAGCVGLAAATGCMDGDTGAIETGPLNGNGNGSGNTMPDAGTTNPPMDGGGTMATCGSGAADVGAPSTFLLDKPIYFSTGRYFVVRDSGGIYAVTALCTHEGAVCSLITGEYRCPRHGALFKYDGTIVSGPVSQPLKHYSACLLANGHVGVDTTKVVAKTVRLNA
jgi:nitrite reductase/ring-hydroxylating ferredoxin subunit